MCISKKFLHQIKYSVCTNLYTHQKLPLPSQFIFILFFYIVETRCGAFVFMFLRKKKKIERFSLLLMLFNEAYKVKFDRKNKDAFNNKMGKYTLFINIFWIKSFCFAYEIGPCGFAPLFFNVQSKLNNKMKNQVCFN